MGIGTNQPLLKLILVVNFDMATTIYMATDMVPSSGNDFERWLPRHQRSAVRFVDPWPDPPVSSIKILSREYFGFTSFVTFQGQIQVCFAIAPVLREVRGNKQKATWRWLKWKSGHIRRNNSAICEAGWGWLRMVKSFLDTSWKIFSAMFGAGASFGW